MMVQECWKSFSPVSTSTVCKIILAIPLMDRLPTFPKAICGQMPATCGQMLAICGQINKCNIIQCFHRRTTECCGVWDVSFCVLTSSCSPKRMHHFPRFPCEERGGDQIICMDLFWSSTLQNCLGTQSLRGLQNYLGGLLSNPR